MILMRSEAAAEAVVPMWACEERSCRWRGQQGQGGSQAAVMVVMILALCAVMSAVALSIGIRGLRILGRRRAKERDLEGVGAVAVAVKSEECAICLSEMEEGESIRVMGKCEHSFHDHCIRRWFLTSSSTPHLSYSCPTCRRPCSS